MNYQKRFFKYLFSITFFFIFSMPNPIIGKENPSY
jgi:hypothetical protein